MKMYKAIALVLALMVLVSGCGCAKNEENNQGAGEKATLASEIDTNAAEEGSAQAESAEAATEEEKIKIDLAETEKQSEFYWSAAEEGDLNIMYHKEGCEKLTKEATPINIGVAQSIGLRQCPDCLPEKYEGYAE